MSSRSTESAESDVLPPDASATEALENAIAESRREYDRKVETMEEIDDKAMRSVRTAVILAGLAVSAVSVSGPSAVGEFTLPTVLVGAFGVGMLTAAIASGIGVYTVTRYTAGIGSAHRADVIEGGYRHAEWLVVMLRQYDEWSERIEDELRTNRVLLEVTQLSLLLGILALCLAASMVVAKSAYQVSPLVPLAAVLLVVSALGTRIL